MIYQVLLSPDMIPIKLFLMEVKKNLKDNWEFTACALRARKQNRRLRKKKDGNRPEPIGECG
jgi:hypothetical protein